MNKREIEFDLMRLMAMLAVIVTHVCGSEIHTLSVNSSDFIWLNMIRAALTWDVPIFVMISGRFFLDIRRRITIKRIYTKYIKHLVIAFLAWSFVYTIYYMTVSYMNGNNVFDMWKEYIFEFLTGPYHMWYIFMIIALYIITPILRKISEEKKMMEYFILLFFVSQFIQQYGAHLPIIGETITTILNKSYFCMTLGYTGYFILGYYLFRYQISNKKEIALYILTIFSVLFSCVGTTFQSMQDGVLNEFISTYQTPNVIIESCGIYVFFIKKRYGIKFNNYVENFILTLGKWGLGIYFVHALVLEILSFTGISPILITPLFGVGLMSIVVFIISIILVWILRKIPFLNKYMM